MLSAQTLLEIGDGGNIKNELQENLGTMVVIIHFNVYSEKILVVHKTIDVKDITAYRGAKEKVI